MAQSPKRTEAHRPRSHIGHKQKSQSHIGQNDTAFKRHIEQATSGRRIQPLDRHIDRASSSKRMQPQTTHRSSQIEEDTASDGHIGQATSGKRTQPHGHIGRASSVEPQRSSLLAIAIVLSFRLPTIGRASIEA